MKKLMAALCCFMLVASPLAVGQDKPKTDEKKTATAAKKEAPKKEPTEKQKAQQQKMKDCSKQASDKKLKGDERKKFMSTCMKG